MGQVCVCGERARYSLFVYERKKTARSDEGLGEIAWGHATATLSRALTGGAAIHLPDTTDPAVSFFFYAKRKATNRSLSLCLSCLELRCGCMASSNPAVSGERQEPLLQAGEVAFANAGEWRWAAASRSLVGWKEVANRQFKQTKCRFWGPRKRKEHTESREGNCIGGGPGLKC